MYSTSTQKKHWTFSEAAEIEVLRANSNDDFKARYRPVLENIEQEHDFLTPAEEALLCRIVTETGIRFGDDFRPLLWPSVRWIAFAYFKRFYLYQSTMEYFPKNVMMACYYLAAKIDEFNISIDSFVGNLRNGSKESNIETITTLEPALISKLKYHLTVHCPFRPLEGHFIAMKTKCVLNFDLETTRSYCVDFLKKALIGDAMLLFPPSQIALAALQYGLTKIGIKDEVLRKYLVKIMEIDTMAPDVERTLTMEKLQLRADEIIRLVFDASEAPLNQGDSTALQSKMQNLMQLQTRLDTKLQPYQNNETTEPFDSDDDF